MDIFNLPDLGEGLPDAVIHEWLVKEGDTIGLDQTMVLMETAKAIVDIPAPQAGTIGKLFGGSGDTIKTGEPLMAFAEPNPYTANKNSIVGHLSEIDAYIEQPFIIGHPDAKPSPKTTPANRILARKLQIDLSQINGTDEYRVISRKDIEAAASVQEKTPQESYESISHLRRYMSSSMTLSHQKVVPVSIFDQVDIQRWSKSEDITVRIIRAIQEACHQEPALNAWYQAEDSSRLCFKQLNLGLAVDSPHGLLVPVIHHVESKSNFILRESINDFKSKVSGDGLSASQFKDPSFILSNFGKFAGKFATPIVLPPMVAILAVGRIFSDLVIHQGQVEEHRFLPLSLSFDHRAVTGGEATRFLGILIEALSSSI